MKNQSLFKALLGVALGFVLYFLVKSFFQIDNNKNDLETKSYHYDSKI